MAMEETLEQIINLLSEETGHLVTDMVITYRGVLTDQTRITNTLVPPNQDWVTNLGLTRAGAVCVEQYGIGVTPE